MPIRGYIRSLERCAEGIKRKLNRMVYDDVILYVSAGLGLIYCTAVPSKFQHPAPGIPWAFDAFSCPGGRTFDHHS